jgi:hypothetical protein
MRIGIDARLFGTRHGGIGRYSEQLIKNLEKLIKLMNIIFSYRNPSLIATLQQLPISTK